MSQTEHFCRTPGGTIHLDVSGNLFLVPSRPWQLMLKTKIIQEKSERDFVGRWLIVRESLNNELRLEGGEEVSHVAV